MIVVVMGVTGSGKTTVGRALAETLGWRFFDADDFHSAENVEKMAAGRPLDDSDRAPWLAQLNAMLRRLSDEHADSVLACSALRETYRSALADGVDGVRFVYLRTSAPLAARRTAARTEHFMPAALVASQFEVLEEPSDAIVLDASLPVSEIVAKIVSALGP